MSKLQPKQEVYDSYQEHEKFHQSFHGDCSSCFTENLVIQTNHEQMLKKYPALKSYYPNRNNPNE